MMPGWTPIHLHAFVCKHDLPSHSFLTEAGQHFSSLTFLSGLGILCFNTYKCEKNSLNVLDCKENMFFFLLFLYFILGYLNAV